MLYVNVFIRHHRADLWGPLCFDYESAIPFPSKLFFRWALSFYFGDNMADLIDRAEAIEKLEKIRAEHARRTCSRESLRQADALGYAIAILQKIPKYESG